PTNDLDIDTLTVIEDYLDDWPGTLIVVTHDRYFLERVTDVTYALTGNGLCAGTARRKGDGAHRRSAGQTRGTDHRDARDDGRRRPRSRQADGTDGRTRRPVGAQGIARRGVAYRGRGVAGPHSAPATGECSGNARDDVSRPARAVTGDYPVLVLGADEDRAVTPDEVRATARAYHTDAHIVGEMGHDFML